MNFYGFRRGSIYLTALASGIVACSGHPGDVSSQETSAITSTGVRQQLSGHLTSETQNAKVVGRVPAGTTLSVTLGLKKPDEAGLLAFANAVANPASPLYRKYLSHEDFVARFGAPAADYAAMVAWARGKNLEVDVHPDGLTAHLTGTVANLEAAFNVHFNYALRPDGTQFHVVDQEPSLDLTVPVDHISNLENYIVPRSHSGGGSASNGYMTGKDFRNVYAPGTTLTGAGQSIGVLMWGAITPGDITQYVTSTGLNAYPLAPQFVEGNGLTGIAAAGQADDENTLDFEMALSTAPAAQIVGFTGSLDTIIGNMEKRPDIKQFTASYSFVGDSNFVTMLAYMTGSQGQSFFLSSGDDGAVSPGEMRGNYESVLLPYITIVGGTDVTMSNQAWSSEVVWGGGAWASGGGIGSPANNADGGFALIPDYQATVSSYTASPVSTTYRNYPDVSAEAWGVGIYLNGASSYVGGTSAATPLWAGFMALVNEEAAWNNLPSIGFANPVLYDIAQNPAYSVAFHDIVSGANPCVQGGANQGVPCLTPNDPSFSATVNYDLATGLGSPRVELIGALNGLLQSCTASWSCVGAPDYSGQTTIACGEAIPITDTLLRGQSGGPLTSVAMQPEGTDGNAPLVYIDMYDPGPGVTLQYELVTSSAPEWGTSNIVTVTTTDCSCSSPPPVCPSDAACGSVANSCGQEKLCGGSCTVGDVCSNYHCCPRGDDWNGTKCVTACTTPQQCCTANGGSWFTKPAPAHCVYQ